MRAECVVLARAEVFQRTLTIAATPWHPKDLHALLVRTSPVEYRGPTHHAGTLLGDCRIPVVASEARVYVPSWSDGMHVRMLLRSPSALPVPGPSECGTPAVLRELPERLLTYSGAPKSGVQIWRDGGSTPWWPGTVGEFLLVPAHQSGRWLIAGVWDNPPEPSPYAVEWRDGQWAAGGW